jgi:hypothetical protein
MASKKKKVDEEQSAPKILTGDDINIEELFARLKEFENKALLDRLKVIESSIAGIHKTLIIDRALLKDIKQHVAYLSLAHEELLNNIGAAEASSYHEPDEEEVQESVTGKTDKKWN